MESVRTYSKLDILRLNTPGNFERLRHTPLQLKFDAIEARCKEIIPSILKENNCAPVHDVRKLTQKPTKAIQPLLAKISVDTFRKSEQVVTCCPPAQENMELVAELLVAEKQRLARKKKNYLRRRRARRARESKRELEESFKNSTSSSADEVQAMKTKSAESATMSSGISCEGSDGEHVPHVVLTLKVAELTSVQRLPRTPRQVKTAFQTVH